MKTNTAIIILLVFLGLGGMFFWGYQNRVSTASSVQGAVTGDKTATENNSVLTTSDAKYDFGTISMKNGKVEKDFVITNPTDVDVSLTALYTSCMCTEAFIVKADGAADGPYGMEGMSHHRSNAVSGVAIKPKESLKIKVVYDPNAHGPAGVGAIDRFVFLRDANGGFLQLEIKAIVTP